MFLTGPAIVEKVTRERVTALDLGSEKVHSKNGVAHLVADGDSGGRDGPRRARPPALEGRRRLPLYPPDDPAPGDPADVLPERDRQVYDVRDVAARLVDGGTMLELGPRWARNLVVGLARIEARPVGVIANQPRPSRHARRGPSQKGTWFVDLCRPLQRPARGPRGHPGVPAGVGQEKAGVIRHGASLLRAFSVATTPRMTVTLRQAYGGAHIVMNSRDLRSGSDHGLAERQDRRHGRHPGGRDRTPARDRRRCGSPPSWRTPTRPSTCRSRWPRSRGFVDEVTEPSRP